VSGLVLEHGGDATLAMAGVLHDALEDTAHVDGALRAAFGDEVARIVESCTDLLPGDRPDARSRLGAAQTPTSSGCARPTRARAWWPSATGPQPAEPRRGSARRGRRDALALHRDAGADALVLRDECARHCARTCPPGSSTSSTALDVLRGFVPVAAVTE
jgi:hypothetical protein